MLNDNNENKYNLKNFFKDLINIRALPANILSLSRIAAPLVIPPIALSGNLPLAILTSAAFLLTDFADGKLARVLNGQTKLGEKLDQIADKICAAGLLIGLIPSFPAMTISLILEGTIAFINAKILKYQGQAQSTLSGKIKMWPLSLMTIAGYTSIALNNPSLVLNIILYSSLITTTAMQMINIAEYQSIAEDTKYLYNIKKENEEYKKRLSEKEKTEKSHDKKTEKHLTTDTIITKIDKCTDIDTLKALKTVTNPENVKQKNKPKIIIKTKKGKN